MARLHEYQGKAILAANGFQISRGRAASTADEAVAVAKDLAAGRKGVEVVVNEAPEDATVRAANALGGVAP
jgi:succinyl-CoA synthetase beta subunit